MSRGGFGGGRGGFGGGANRSGPQQLMSFDLIKDLGVNGLFNVQTDLFPKMDVPVPRKSSSNEQTQWRLRRDYLERIKQSAFHLTVPPPPKDLDMFPEELQSILDPSKAKKKRKNVARDDYGQIEALLDKANDDKDEDDEDGEKPGSDVELEEEEYEDEEELVDDNDYGQNYFDNGEDDGDGDDDGDGENYY
ncbi:hypothetical protein [Absidia glauca]|uniref:DNA-directed RNA polymerase III subunit n=1 Tax=Absidia glauca TaxID=4829 RepID=A0A168TAM4_ABSGL|nr:hypothetical protein [Absidia glauca]